jgi:RNA polymerase sigma-70 factor (ECF subfamily)
VTAALANKSNRLSDAELIALFLQGRDTSYFTQLYRRYAGKVFAKCYSMLSDEGMARDATQDIFIKILGSLSRFTEKSSFSTWLYAVTYNYCIDVIRRRKKNLLIFTEDPGRISDETETEVPDSLILDMETRRLEQVMDKIPPGDRAILNMKYIDDLSVREIAEVLHKTESAIKMQLMRAKAKAQEVYQDLYGDDPVGQ